MSKLADVEMELVPEASDDLVRTGKDGREEALSKQIEPETSEGEKSLQQSAVTQGNWYARLQHIDPVFYITSLLAASFLIIGFYFFLEYNNRLVAAHLSGLEASKEKLDEMFAFNKAVMRSQPPEIDIPQSSSAESVSVQSRLRASPSSASNSDTKVDSSIAQSREVAELQSLLSEKTRQLELLALENHELRLSIEFGSAAPVEQSINSVNNGATETVGSDSTAKDVSSGRADTAVDPQSSKSVERLLTDTAVLVSHAKKSVQEEDYISAEKWYSLAVQKDPSDREANIGVASVAVVTGNLHLAIDRYRHLLRLNPDDQSVFIAMLDLATPDNVIETELLSHVSQLASDQAKYHSIMGHYFGRKGRWEEANEAFTNALAGRANQADVLFNLAVSYEHLGLIDEAVEYYRQALTATDNEGINHALVKSRLSELVK